MSVYLLFINVAVCVCVCVECNMHFENKQQTNEGDYFYQLEPFFISYF